MNYTVIAYLFLGSVLAVVHFLSGDAGGILTPGVKGALSIVATLLAALLPSLQSALKSAFKPAPLTVVK